MRSMPTLLSIMIALTLAACAGSDGAPVNEPETTVTEAVVTEAVATESTAPKTTSSEADAAASWPHFHGPDGRNISPDTGLLKSWPEGGPKLIWTATGIGLGYASVSVAGGRLYTAGSRGEETVVSALDLDGKVLWQAADGPAWTDSYEGSRGTPTIAGDRVYYQSPHGELACLDTGDGSKIWSVNVLQRFAGENTRWGLAESVLVDGDRVITSPGGAKASVAALERSTGKTVWTTPSTGSGAGYTSPVLVEVAGVRLILTMTAEELIGVDADSGALLFSHTHTTSYGVNATMPIYHDGKVFISSGYGSGSELLEITTHGGRLGLKKLWESKELDDQHGGVILYQGHLYGAAHKANGGRWICLDWQTGAMRYAEKGVGKGSVTLADGMLYTLSEKRQVGLVAATPESHTLISSFTLPDGGDGPTWAHPVVCGGRLYLRHGDLLFAYDVRG